MVRKVFRYTLPFTALAVVLSVALLVPSSVCAERCRETHCQPYGDSYGGDLFYNYYAGGTCDVPAQLYLSPRPTPPLVGHTYYTYQPLMPHEFLYKHHRSYHGYSDGGRTLTRTIVNYHSNPIKSMVLGIRDHFRLPR